MPQPHLPVRVRCLEDGRAALTVGRELGIPVLLASDPGAAAFAGPGWWAALVRLLAQEAPGYPFTAVLDCGNAPGVVLAALRAGVTDVAYDGPADIAAKLADIAGQVGARLHPPVRQAADLRGSRDRIGRLRRIGSRFAVSGQM